MKQPLHSREIASPGKERRIRNDIIILLRYFVNGREGRYRTRKPG